MKLIFSCRRLYHYIFGEKFYKRLDFKWHKHPNRFYIIQDIIYRKKYNSYLEIGCQNDVLFSKIKIGNKVGVDPISGGTASTGATPGTAPTTICTYFPPSTTYLTTASWGTPTVAATTV